MTRYAQKSLQHSSFEINRRNWRSARRRCNSSLSNRLQFSTQQKTTEKTGPRVAAQRFWACQRAIPAKFCCSVPEPQERCAFFCSSLPRRLCLGLIWSSIAPVPLAAPPYLCSVVFAPYALCPDFDPYPAPKGASLLPDYVHHLGRRTRDSVRMFGLAGSEGWREARGGRLSTGRSRACSRRSLLGI